jgi:predicted nuclease with TOPRIM domain
VRVLPDSDKELKEKLQSFKEDMDRIVRENTAKQHLLIEKNSELKNMCLLNQRLRDERTKSRLEKEELDSALQKINELVLEISEIHDIHQPHDLQFTHVRL